MQNNLLQRLQLGCDGGAAAEFVIVVPLLLLLILTIYEFGRAYWVQNTLQYAAEQTGRCLMANPAASVTSGTCDVSNFLAGLTANTPTTGTAPCSLGTCQWVEVTYTFNFITGLSGLMAYVSAASVTLPTITLAGWSQVPIS